MQSTTWRKSSHSSDPESACCVEVAAIGDARMIRDSMDPDGPRLTLTPQAFRSLINAVKTL